MAIVEAGRGVCGYSVMPGHFCHRWIGHDGPCAVLPTRDEHCQCAAIMARDSRRHFKGCPCREKLPYSPAIEKLLRVARGYVEVCRASPVAAITLATVTPRAFEEALREVDAEARALGQSCPSVNEQSAAENKKLDLGVEPAVERTKPGGHPGSVGGGASNAPLTAEPSREERHAKSSR